jgi:hypothetical protein
VKSCPHDRNPWFAGPCPRCIPPLAIAENLWKTTKDGQFKTAEQLQAEAAEARENASEIAADLDYCFSMTEVA